MSASATTTRARPPPAAASAPSTASARPAASPGPVGPSDDLAGRPASVATSPSEPRADPRTTARPGPSGPSQEGRAEQRQWASQARMHASSSGPTCPRSVESIFLNRCVVSAVRSARAARSSAPTAEPATQSARVGVDGHHVVPPWPDRTGPAAARAAPASPRPRGRTARRHRAPVRSSARIAIVTPAPVPARRSGSTTRRTPRSSDAAPTPRPERGPRARWPSAEAVGPPDRRSQPDVGGRDHVRVTLTECDSLLPVVRSQPSPVVGPTRHTPRRACR